ncbi:ThiF family adenylyltransferase [Macrococcus equipercicus]|uniref:ThiF family adenylyltransferase n=1 Tax=Macrococcus equipercicus TaxID=69967 RepID=A0ABQ6RAM1_9STAP|nr:ThiF family adenylyltransferase [Macrococcus equipercicus]KAA1042307.1 ThiF family adenylyltransferase [Macrococcus equipercicus]
MKLKLRSSVSVIDRKDDVIEFFKTNTREQVIIKSFHPILKTLLSEMNGEITLNDFVKKYDISEQYNALQTFINFLISKGILSDILPESMNNYSKFRRVIHFLEDYSTSADHLAEMWNKIQNRKVVIIGLGAVGTWTAINLVQNGVKDLVLIDDDIIEISNLHRQMGYEEQDIGEFKTDALKRQLLRMNKECNITCIYEPLDNNLLEKHRMNNSNLIINCADKPTVDQTSLLVGEYCMRYKIPHIVGGGYNLHLSLIGQTIIPFKSACVKCFEKQLQIINAIDPKSVKKLTIKNRKLGSFGPACSIIASFIGMEAIKVLSECTMPANLNRRGEFNIYNMDIEYRNFERLKDCEWCGKDGEYYAK